MTYQETLTVIAPIKADQMDCLREVLQSIQQNVGHNDLIPFAQFPQVHFARFVILEAVKDPLLGITIPPSLAFSNCLDAPLKEYLRSLAEEGGYGLDRIFSHCEGYPSPQRLTVSSRIAYLQKHRVNTQTFYVNTIGRTVQQVRQEADLHDKIELFLDRYQHQQGADGSDVDTVRRAIQNFVKQDPSLSWALTPAVPPDLGWQIRDKLHLIVGLFLILLLGLAFLPISPLFVAILRWKEETAPHPRQDPKFRLSQFHRLHLAQDEDFFSQNQFSVVGFVKPGWFRYITLRVILWLANFATRHVFNNGDLGTVPLLNLYGVDTIHFARWVVIDQGRRVLFMSNYDFNLEDYMNDFINKLAWGLNIIFGHGVDYPKTSWLVKGGARDEQIYKAVLRKYQIRSQVWYAAYPNLSAVNISNNAQIRAGLFQPLDTAQQQAWLSRF
ncbi:MULTISPECIES: hypothetical protein [unclassified Moorena]|uniref:hypothetical protein n=1 Tax=unclassified Moorena TaxID=2683338 RepID=UPI0013C68E56|nr:MULTISPECIES: hypothetical protein [unclassified Moorena]NEO20521.1 hypothetical protein [Moorena sp. SIO4A5]NEP25556.1 hypothetical protein [Moorena sp. SIO3I6]NEQ57860.1 hypothetical protein [Moorena sp. SIO4A1]